MPRFAVLEHRWNDVHWDFMLEDGDTLKTWALEAPPAPGVSIPARQSADHRLMYLEYEGEISGGRGHVIRWDAGTFAWRRREADWIEVELQGERLRGNVHLRAETPGTWSFQWK